MIKIIALYLLEYVILFISVVLSLLVFGVFISPFITNDSWHFFLMVLFTTGGLFVGDEAIRIVKKY